MLTSTNAAAAITRKKTQQSGRAPGRALYANYGIDTFLVAFVYYRLRHCKADYCL